MKMYILLWNSFDKFNLLHSLVFKEKKILWKGTKIIQSKTISELSFTCSKFQKKMWPFPGKLIALVICFCAVFTTILASTFGFQHVEIYEFLCAKKIEIENWSFDLCMAYLAPLSTRELQSTRWVRFFETRNYEWSFKQIIFSKNQF